MNAKTTLIGFKIAELLWDAETLEDLTYLTTTCDDIIKIRKEHLETMEYLK